MVPTLKIIEKLKALSDQITEDKLNGDTTVGDNLSWKASDAILGGPGSQAWRDYMKFVIGPDSPAELARLSLEDSLKDDPIIRQNAAYIVANGACGSFTTGPTHQRVTTDIERIV